MTIIHGVVGQVNERDSRYYVKPVTNRLFESVTNTIELVTNPSHALVPWSAKLAAEYSVAHYALIGRVIEESSPEDAVNLIKAVAQRQREIARDIGIYLHDVIEALVLDGAIPSPPEHIDGIEVDGESADYDAIMDGFLNFVEDHDAEFEMAEATVANTELGYAGTADLIAHLRNMDRRLLIDAKTGRHLKAQMRAQLAAYRACDEVWIDHSGTTAPMPQVDGCAILHIRREHPRGYKLIEVEAGDAELAWFKDMLAVAERHRANTKLDGRVLYKPLADGSQPLPLIEDVDSLGRAKAPLLKAGLTSLGQVAELTDQLLRTVPGIGPKSVPLVLAALAGHGLELRKAAA